MPATHRKTRVRPSPSESEVEPTFSLVLRTPSGATIDYVDARLLSQIAEQKSISKAAREIGVSYRNAWERLDILQGKLKRKIVIARVGGAKGGSAELTADGRSLAKEYRRLNDYLLGTLDDKDFWQHIGYRLSARNRMRARIVEVNTGPITSEIKMELHPGGRLTSIISNEAVQDLGLAPGDTVEAIVKATEVVIAKPEGGPALGDSRPKLQK